MSGEIEVVGSVNPDKECQDHCRVLSTEGICVSVRATDYKAPPKILVKVKRGKQADISG